MAEVGTEQIDNNQPDTTQAQPDVQVQQDDIFAVVEQRFGRKIDEDYLNNDYREQYQNLSKNFDEVRTKVEASKHIFENPDLLKIADYVKDGVGIKEALQALTLNVDEIPEDQLIVESVTRKNKFLKDKSDIDSFLENKFGIGTDLEILKEEYPEKYFDILKNRQEAIEDGKSLIEAKKLELLTPAQQHQQSNIFSQEQLQNLKSQLSAEVESFENITLGDVATPYDKKVLTELSDHIVFSGDIEGHDRKVTVIDGFTSQEVLNALYLLKNKDAHLNEFVKEVNKAKSIEAIKKADELYNNVGGAQQQTPGGTKMARPVSADEVKQKIRSSFS